MTEGIKPEYWDFIFEGLDPYCDMKLTDIIDLYFNIAESEAKKNNNFIKLNILNRDKYQIRRQRTKKDGWLMEIPTSWNRSREITITNNGTKRLLKHQYSKFIAMLTRLRCN